MKTILRKSGEDSFLRDALRDLVVVVVGILAALWIEATWQDYQNRQEEQSILIGLRDEFATNRAELERLIARWIQTRTNIQEVHSFMGGTLNDEMLIGFEEALVRFLTTSGGSTFDPRHGQLTSVLTSGKLGLIRNQELRALVADWPTVVADIDVDESLLFSLFMGSWGELQSEHVRNWPDSRFESRLGELMMDRRFDFGLGNVFWLFSIIISEGEGLLGSTDTIIELIDAELEGR